MEINSYMEKLIDGARNASIALSMLSAQEKNAILSSIADLLEKNSGKILEANKLDLAAAKDKMTKSELDRLTLTKERIVAIANDVRTLIALPDPVGRHEDWTMPNGLEISRVRVPFGVIGAIYENRPNVTIDIAVLCVKSGNACILRGSASALHSNRALVAAVAPAAPKGAVLLVDTPDRAAVDVMMAARGKIDLLIPRGGPELIARTVLNSKVPVIETGTGNCHVFVDESADLDMAERVILNAKCQRPSVCNAEEKLLVHESIAKEFLPRIAKVLRAKGVEIRACPKTLRFLATAGVNGIVPATDADWPKEYLDLIIAIKVVSDVKEAIAHINKYNSKHTEAIITKNNGNAQLFTKTVDAAVVMVNASTRFTDGGQFGFGSEVGISTQKLHARGPMGLNELTCTKYIVHGNGQIRA